jgi:4-carboxymuconolactone decarboxylase
MGAMPKNFVRIQEKYGNIIDILQQLGQATTEAGPLDVKTGHLLQMAAGAALRSEGAVHSHVRRALKAGVSAEELRHAMVLLIPTIGFPTVAAALSWVDDVIGED